MPELNEDERFESYLKQFRPLMPDALPVNEISRTPRRRLVLAIRALGAVAVVALGVVTVRNLNHRFGEESHSSAPVNLLASTPPLTMRGANALLASAPSYKAVMNQLAFPAESSTIPKDKQSALAVLGKEKTRL